MQSSFSLFFGILLFLSFASASGLRSIPFFRSPQSLVPSGHESLSILAARENQRLKRNQIRVETTRDGESKAYSLEFGDVATDIHVSEWVMTQHSTPLFKEAALKYQIIKKIAANSHVQILSISGEWAEVYVPEPKLRGFMRWLELKTNYFDMGVYYLMLPTSLKSTPAYSGKILQKIPAGARFQARSRANGWIEIDYKGSRGFIPTNVVLTKFDFAVSMSENKKNWSKYKPSLAKRVEALYTDSNKGIVCGKIDELNIRQSVKLLPEFTTEWVQSQIPEHGLVWWKPIDKEKVTLDSPTELKIEELLKRNVYSVSFHPENEKIGLASADGVYFTTDGENWKRLEFFDDSEYSVHIHSDGSWFVGAYRSTDQGKHFKEYLQWDRITRVVQAAITQSPRFLKMVSLKTAPHNSLEMVLDTGYKKVRLVSSTAGETWLYKK